MEAGSINCLVRNIFIYTSNRNLLIIARLMANESEGRTDSLPAHYVEYLLLIRLILLIHLDRRTPKLVTDGAGRMMTDTSGASQLTYKPYGEVNRMNSYGPDIFRYKYTGQQDDQDTGLYYYKARYYDPVLGLFTSADNVTNATSSFGLNHYMYVEGNPVRWGDDSGNFLVPLLYSAMAFAVGTVAAIAIGGTIAVAMAVANTVMATAAIAQTAAIATATFVANAAIVAVQTAIFVNALGFVGGGVGFISEGIKTKSLQGALGGAEVGFKIGSGVTIAAWIAVGAFIIGAYVGAAIATGIAFLGLNATVAMLLGYAMTFTIGGLYGELAKAVGRNAGGHLGPHNKGFKYDKRSAAHGEAAGDFLSTSGSLAGGLWDATGFLDECAVDETYYHSFDKMGAEIVNTNTLYFTEKIFIPIFQSVAEGAVWSEAGNPNPRGSY